MVAWANVGLMSLSTGLAFWLYVKSVSPAALERKIGPKAYTRCGRYRTAAMVCMFLVCGSYILYFYHPLPLAIPERFCWPYPVSLILAAVLGVPSAYLFLRGIKDAGAETMIPNPQTKMYGGIYNHIRHPQAWEGAWWMVIALMLDSPFLALFSLLWVPLTYWMMRAEEKDLLLRFGIEYQNYMDRTGMFWPRRN